MSKPLILLLGVDQELKDQLTDIFEKTRIEERPLKAESIMGHKDGEIPSIILTAIPPTAHNLPPKELAQLLRMNYPEVPCYIYFKMKEGFQKKELIQNGFNEAFLLPTDRSHMRSVIAGILAIASHGEIRVYRPVKIIDINAGDTLQFDTSLYLPTNHKYVKLTHSGDSLNEERIHSIKNHHFNNLQVTLEQMGRFYEYTAMRIKKLRDSPGSETEKQEKMAESVRHLMSDLFDDHTATFESGQEILHDCNEIVKNFLETSNDDWYTRIQQILGESGDDYSHASNTSTLAALFSLGLGIGKPEDLAIAGLLHDIGITELPYDVQNIAVENMSKEQFLHYQKHPELSTKLIRTRKIMVNDDVIKIILQHHELYNGSGYPKGLAGAKIMKEAQILAIADRFDELTSIRDDKGMLTSPLAVAALLREEQMADPTNIKYNPELLQKILDLFPKPDQKEKSS